MVEYAGRRPGIVGELTAYAIAETQSGHHRDRRAADRARPTSEKAKVWSAVAEHARRAQLRDRSRELPTALSGVHHPSRPLHTRRGATSCKPS